VGGPFLAGFLAFYAFLAFYPDWAGISSFGNRFFSSMTPLFVLGLGFLLSRVAGLFARPRTALAVLSALLLCFVSWNLGLMYQWGTHLIPARGPISFREATANQFTVFPRQLSFHLRSYFSGRSHMMRQIEERDLEQLKKSGEP
jgi:hypothetical protein